MKLCSFVNNGNPDTGLKTEQGIISLTALGFPSRMNEIIKGGPELQEQISQAVKNKGVPVLNEDAINFLPITEPEKIICEGLNYKSHAEETGGTAPEHPVFFSKFNDSLSADGQDVTLPTWLGHRFDYEAELVIVIGKAAYNVTPEEAELCIFGYTCGNDLSARDSQFLSTQWLSGKALPGFAPVGPYIVTRDGFNPNESHGIHCEVNGERVQSGDTSDMIFTCTDTVSAASRFFPLSPGDLIFTGTPAGVIMGRPKDKRIWLKQGDIVKVIIDGIGTLTNRLV